MPRGGVLVAQGLKRCKSKKGSSNSSRSSTYNFGQIPLKRYQSSYSSSNGLNSITAVFLEGCRWHAIKTNKEKKNLFSVEVI